MVMDVYDSCKSGDVSDEETLAGGRIVIVCNLRTRERPERQAVCDTCVTRPEAGGQAPAAV